MTEYTYSSTNCLAGTELKNTSVPTDMCIIHPRGYEYNSVSLGCAYTTDEIEVTGNFVVQLFFNESTCGATDDTNAVSFLGYTSGYCFIDQENNATSLTFGCSQESTGPQAKLYDNSYCGANAHTYTTHFNPYCHHFTTPPYGKNNRTISGYDEYVCIAQNTTIMYDDDTTDDSVIDYQYSYILVNDGGCFNDDSNTVIVLGFENSVCTPYLDNVYATHQCNTSASVTYVYSDKFCTPESFIESFSTPSDSCFDFQFDSVNIYSATFGCALNLAGIPVSGNFAAVSLYNETESTCNTDPDAFLGFSFDTCFPSPFGYNDTNSFSFGCSRSYGGPDVHFYDDLFCDVYQSTVHLDPSCQDLFNTTLLNSTILGYYQYQCVSIDVNPVYDDDFGTDDAIVPTGYVYVQYFEDLGCTGQVTYAEGVALGKCLLLYNDFALVVGSILNTCSGNILTEYVYSSDDCTGTPEPFVYSSVDTCVAYSYEDDYFNTFNTLYGQSYKISCNTEYALPVTAKSIVVRLVLYIN